MSLSRRRRGRRQTCVPAALRVCFALGSPTNACVSRARPSAGCLSTHTQLRSAVLAGGPGGGPMSAEQALFALTSATATKEALVERMQRRCRRTHADLVRIERKVAQAAEERARSLPCAYLSALT